VLVGIFLPIVVLAALACSLYMDNLVHAVNDKGMPAEAIERLDRALEAWGGKYESEIYEGAYHSWTVPDSPVYNQPQADRAFAKLTQLSRKHWSSAGPLFVAPASRPSRGLSFGKLLQKQVR